MPCWTPRSQLSCAAGVALCLMSACKDFPAPPVEMPAIENLLDCELATPCGIFSPPNEGPGSPPQTSYTEAQACVLQAFADAQALRFHYNSGCEGMCYGEAIVVREDLSVLRQDYAEVFEDGVDFNGIEVEFESWDMAQRCELVDTSYFTQCLSAFDATCLSRSNWYVDCQDLSEAPSCSP